MADTGELIHVDPAQLVIGENVRVDADVDPHLVASVKRRGVLEPIVAYRDGEGRLVVLHGQRRTCAAVKAGVADVPVWVRDAPDAADRIVDQVAENDHRNALAAGDRLAAYEQLSAIGLSAAQIAHRAAKPRVEIDAALKTVASPAARTAFAEHGLTIEQAAAIAEFEHRPGAVVRLIESAQDGGRGWEHRLQYFRDQEPELALRDAKVAELEGQGVKVVDRIAGKARALDALDLNLDVDAHASCPGHAATVEVDREWGDDAPEDDPGKAVAYVDYLCTDPVEYGHSSADNIPPGQHAGDAAAAAKEAALREAEAAKRREVVTNNKAWRSAETVRRTWLRQLAVRKTPPKGGAAFLAAELALGSWELTNARQSGNKLAYDLLGLETPDWNTRGIAIAEHVDTATEARAQLVALLLILAAIEEGTGVETWRTPSSAARRYLRWIADQGYELCDVERLAAGLDTTSDGAG